MLNFNIASPVYALSSYRNRVGFASNSQQQAQIKDLKIDRYEDGRLINAWQAPSMISTKLVTDGIIKDPDHVVTILGSGFPGESEESKKYENAAGKLARYSIKNGNDVLTAAGILRGTIGKAAVEAELAYREEIKDGKKNPGKSLGLSILHFSPVDTKAHHVIAQSRTDYERIDQVRQISNKIYIFPGKLGTFMETFKLIADNKKACETGDKFKLKKKIYLVGKDFWSPINQMFDNTITLGLAGNYGKPSEYFKVISLDQLDKMIEKKAA